MILPFLYFSMTFVSNTITQRPQVSERLYTGQKEVSAGSDRGESWQALDLFPNGPLWDGHVKSAVLCTENWVALVSQLVKVWVVRPHVHRKFKLADEARTAHERGDASLCAVVGDTFRQRRTISPPAPDHLPPVHVHCGIARVHAPDVRTERTAIAVRVHLCVIEIIVALRISTELWIVLIGREDKRSAAPPSSHQLGSYQLLLFRCFTMGSEEIAKRAYVLFHSQIGNIAAVARKSFWLRQSGSRTFFVRIAKEKFARFDRWARSGCRLYSRSLDDWLREPITVAEVFVSVIERGIASRSRADRSLTPSRCFR